MTLYSAAFPGIPSESGSIYGVTSMRGARLLLIAVVLLCGCQWLDNLTQGDGDGNPVMPAAPPRIGARRRVSPSAERPHPTGVASAYRAKTAVRSVAGHAEKRTGRVVGKRVG